MMLHTLAQREEEIILVRLKLCSYNMVWTAKSLGISRATLYRKVKKYNFDRRAAKKVDNASRGE